MTLPSISRQEWLAAGKKLLVAETEYARQRDKLKHSLNFSL
jgi:predicted dithiol-disulfide oxidoreductase (DUF899 family)